MKAILEVLIEMIVVLSIISIILIVTVGLIKSFPTFILILFGLGILFGINRVIYYIRLTKFNN
jgi:hypothetical protein